MLLRGCNTLRNAIELDPGELTHWLGLHELLLLRGASDAAALVAHAANVVGHTHPDLPHRCRTASARRRWRPP